MPSSPRSSRSKRARQNAVIAVLTASTIFGSSEAVLAQAMPAVPSGQSGSVQQQRFFMKVEAGSLDDALTAYTAQTGVRVVRPAGGTAGLQSAGVTGSLTAGDALSALLAGSGYTFRFTSANVATIERGVTTSAGVTTLPPVRVEGQTRAADADPYADPQAPYRADRLSSSKFTESILNTPRSVTVLTKAALDDKNMTTLRELGRSTAGVTLGTGEGGNAFGDRFFIRGFDARNDVFVDGVRDPGVSMRETFDTEQVEILRGPGSSYAGRGTSGGAINIASKQAGDRNFTDAELTAGFSDGTARTTVDINKVISPGVSVRLNGLFQAANVAGRDFTTDDRNGVAAALTFKLTPNVTVKANYSHTNRYGLPDFGVPYNTVAKAPVTSNAVNRSTYYGIVNRDFTSSIQDLATLDEEWKLGVSVTLENKTRLGNSLLAYIGTIPENPSAATPATAPFSSTATTFSGFTQLNAQSRNQPTRVLVDQPQATFKFTFGDFENTAVLGGEFSGEHISIDTYTGFTSELTTGPVAFTSAGAPIVSVYNPTHYLFGAGVTRLTGNPLRYQIDTRAGYLLDTVNLHDTLLLNGGVRYDNYSIGAANNTASNAAQSNITSYNAGLTYKPLKIAGIYFAYATSAEPVGDEIDATSSAYGGFAPTQASTQIYGPQKTRSIELGTKWELFDRHLLATAAAFRNNVTNARETAPAGIAGVASGSIVAGAEYQVSGFDFELAGNITNKLSILGGFVAMTPVVVKSIVPTNNGLPLANLAKQSFNFLAKYEFSSALELGVQSSYASPILGGSLLVANGGVAYPGAPNPTILPQHWRHDAFLETKLTDKVGLKLYVTNIFNATYYDSLYQSAVPFIAIAPGRTVSLIANVKM